MINTGPTFALVALSTLCTVLYIGLGFLPRPSRAAAVWSCAFAGFMLASYAWVAGDALDSAPARAAASGLMFAMTALLWVGLRVRRRAERAHWALAIGTLVALPIALLLTADTAGYLTVVRLALAVSAVFSALVLTELLRLGAHVRDEVLPLALASALVVIFAALSLVHEGVRLGTSPAEPAEEVMALIRELNVIGSLLYVVCATITLLFLTRQRPVDRDSPRDSAFGIIARDRLGRAEAADDRWWSVLVIRLDDPIALREASSTHAFDHIRARFAQEVAATLPAEADLHEREPGEFIALLPRPEGAVRQILARLLERISTTDADAPLTVRLSASVGWASVEVVGYDLDALVTAATAAAERAQSRGGDRWDRVTTQD